MSQHPFPKRSATQEVKVNNRGSTRVEFVCPVVVSGRDANSQLFREETKTLSVNLQGCKLSLAHPVLVGMLVSLETPHTEEPAKAVCVRVWDAAPGQEARGIAVQLLKPHNLWGLKNPPDDWHIVSETLVHGRTGRFEMATLLEEAPGHAAPLPAPAVAKVPAPPPVAVAGEAQLADLEERSWQLMDSVLQTLRDQTDELIRDTMEDFRLQVEALLNDAQARLKEQVK